MPGSSAQQCEGREHQAHLDAQQRPPESKRFLEMVVVENKVPAISTGFTEVIITVKKYFLSSSE